MISSGCLFFSQHRWNVQRLRHVRSEIIVILFWHQSYSLHQPGLQPKCGIVLSFPFSIYFFFILTNYCYCHNSFSCSVGSFFLTVEVCLRRQLELLQGDLELVVDSPNSYHICCNIFCLYSRKNLKNTYWTCIVQHSYTALIF